MPAGLRRIATTAAPVVVALGLLGAAAAFGFSGAAASPTAPGRVSVEAGRAAASSVRGNWDRTEVERNTRSTVADAIGPSVTLYSAPDVEVVDDPVMENPTHERLPVVFQVIEDRGPWLHVSVSRRPNGFTAWIRRDQVELRELDHLVLVEVGARRITVFEGSEVLLQEPAAVGTAATPTPLGRFFVDGHVTLRPDTGPYGSRQISVSGFSEVLASFGGGVGQIAIHGTNRPDLIGQDVSNGCVRLTNDVADRVAALAPLGTPVEIVA